ncbi:LuxR C-terminal-related transcriptional regulator [Kitasatospora sp. NPDC028055]|uniref:helix-turn-helix transcriptional regulator n=1 Tax=Kitasatospora sp. NPDC028055 TaxID=3155653 RepID=UPI0033CC3F00
MPPVLPAKPDLSDSEIQLLRQVARGDRNEVVSRVTGIDVSTVGDSVKALTFKLGTPYRHRAAALGVGWGWVRVEDVPALNPDNRPLPDQRRAVLVGLVAGDHPEAIAKRLGLTKGTVETYIQNLLRSLGVRSRQQAAARALLTGIVSLSALGKGWPDVPLADVHGLAPQLDKES